MIKIVGINGSARGKEGKTAKLLQVVLKSAEEAGAQVKTIHLIEESIRYCLGCYSEDSSKCEPRRCTQDMLADSMRALHNLLLFCDGVVFATPIYWFGMSALMKTFVERLTSLENAGKLLMGHVAGFVAVGEEDGAMQAISQLMAITSDMGFVIPPLGFTYYIGRGDPLDDPETVKYAMNLGKNMVNLAKLLNSGGIEWKL